MFAAVMDEEGQICVLWVPHDDRLVNVESTEFICGEKVPWCHYMPYVAVFVAAKKSLLEGLLSMSRFCGRSISSVGKFIIC